MKDTISLKIFKYYVLALSTSIFVGCGSDGCCGGSSPDYKGTIKPLNDTTNDINITDNKKDIIPQIPVIKTPIKDTPITPKGLVNDTNIPPVAIAIVNNKHDYITIHRCQNIQFNGDQSYDEDGNITSYVWTDAENKVLSQDINFSREFCTYGVYEKTLTVTDDKNTTGIDRVCILVDIDKEDIELIAYAGEDKTIALDTNITLSGRAICTDANLTYEWSKDGNVITDNNSFTKSDFTIGSHVLTFSVTDLNDNYSHDSVTITVE